LEFDLEGIKLSIQKEEKGEFSPKSRVDSPKSTCPPPSLKKNKKLKQKYL